MSKIQVDIIVNKLDNGAPSFPKGLNAASIEMNAGIVTANIFSNPSFIGTSYTLDGGTNNYGAFGPISVAVGATVTVGVGNTFVIV